MASLKIDNVRKRFGALDVLRGIDLSLHDGEFLVLLGPSGCGKSTLLNMIAGLDSVSEGEIRIDERVINEVHPKDRDIAMVFQSYALYPNMTVEQNIAFSLKMRGVSAAGRKEAVASVTDLLQIGHLLKRKPAQLSGGQRQRVAMGRALVRNPSVFLFDEPLSNLDAKLRIDMRIEIKRLHARLGTTIVYVTHDQIEAMTLATRIAVMKDGVVQQFGEPQEIYERPANRFVADFIGSPPMNFVPGKLIEHDGKAMVELSDDKVVKLPLYRQASTLSQWIGHDITLGLRPENITPASSDNGGEASSNVAVNGRIDVIEPTGAETLVVFPLGGVDVTAKARPRDRIAKGQELRFSIDMSSANLFDPKTGVSI